MSLSETIAHTARQGASIARERLPAKAALDDTLGALEDKLPPQRFRPVGAYAPGDKPYVTISSDACPTPIEAIASWMRRFIDFLAEETGEVIWWRMKPAIEGELDEDGEPMWTVYGRVALGASE